MKESPFSPEVISRFRRQSMIAAAVAIALCALAALLDIDQFLRSWLLAVLFWWSVSVGALGLVLLHNLTGGRWGETIRPFLLAMLIWLPILAVLFAPLFFLLDRIYPWTSEQFVEHHHRMLHKTQWLNEPFFVGRAVFYFAVWLLWAGLASRWARSRSAAMRQFSGVGLALLVLTASFAAMDWAMSLDPLWHSSIFGGIVSMGGALCALAIGIWMAMRFSTPERVVPADDVPQLRGDLGNLLLAFVMLWTYFSLSQFIIIWMGNLPEEATWYLERSHHGWQWLTVAIIAIAFLVPFTALLSYEVKRSPKALSFVAAVAVIAQFMHWVLMLGPIYYPEGLFLHWADLSAVVAVKALLLIAFFWRLEKVPPPVLHGPTHRASAAQEGAVHA